MYPSVTTDTKTESKQIRMITSSGTYVLSIDVITINKIEYIPADFPQLVGASNG